MCAWSLPTSPRLPWRKLPCLIQGQTLRSCSGSCPPGLFRDLLHTGILYLPEYLASPFHLIDLMKLETCSDVINKETLPRHHLVRWWLCPFSAPAHCRASRTRGLRLLCPPALSTPLADVHLSPVTSTPLPLLLTRGAMTRCQIPKEFLSSEFSMSQQHLTQ